MSKPPTTYCAFDLLRCVLTRSSPTNLGMSRYSLRGALQFDLLATVFGDLL